MTSFSESLPNTSCRSWANSRESGGVLATCLTKCNSLRPSSSSRLLKSSGVTVGEARGDGSSPCASHQWPLWGRDAWSGSWARMKSLLYVLIVLRASMAKSIRAFSAATMSAVLFRTSRSSKVVVTGMS